jgi:hypothetical protein
LERLVVEIGLEVVSVGTFRQIERVGQCRVFLDHILASLAEDDQRAAGVSSLGKVTDFVINDGGCVQYVVVSYQNRFVPVPRMATTYNSADRTLMLGIDQAQLVQIPTFGQYSELSNAQFGQKVNTLFKVDSRASEQRANKPVYRRRRAADSAPQWLQDQQPDRAGPH